MNRALAFSSWIISTYRRTTHGITFTCIFCTVVKYKASFNRDSASSPAQMLMCLRGSRGGGGEGRGPDPPPPWEITKLLGSLAILVLLPWKITKLPSQHSILGHHRPASETPFNVDDPLSVVFESSLSSTTKKLSELIWTPSDKSFWIRAPPSPASLLSLLYRVIHPRSISNIPIIPSHSPAEQKFTSECQWFCFTSKYLLTKFCLFVRKLWLAFRTMISLFRGSRALKIFDTWAT